MAQKNTYFSRNSESEQTKMIKWLILLCAILLTGIAASKEVEILKSNKEIVVAFSKRPPFVFQDQNGELKGLDILIIENFVKKFNLQVKYKGFNGSLSEMFNREETFDNYLMSVNLKNIDIFIGALDQNLVTSKYFTASRAYYHDVLTWCVQTKKPIPLWKNFFFICRDPMIWISFTIMSIVVIFMAYFGQRFEELQPKYDWFRITLVGFAANVGFSSPYHPKILPHQIGYLACVFGAMLSNILYTSVLTLFMNTLIFENQIGSIHELNKGDYKLAGDGFALQHLKEQIQTYPIKLLEDFVVCNDLDQCLSQIDHNAKLAVAISREHARSNRLISFSKLYCFEKFETIHEYALKFLIHKDFPYHRELNRFIQMASDGGLIEKWRSINKIQPKYPIRKKFYGIITMGNFYGIFLLIIIILAHLMILFVFEKIVHREARKPNPFRFWLLIEMAIDPYRHFWLENVTYWK